MEVENTIEDIVQNVECTSNSVNTEKSDMEDSDCVGNCKLDIQHSTDTSGGVVLSTQSPNISPDSKNEGSEYTRQEKANIINSDDKEMVILSSQSPDIEPHAVNQSEFYELRGLNISYDLPNVNLSEVCEMQHGLVGRHKKMVTSNSANNGLVVHVPSSQSPDIHVPPHMISQTDGNKLTEQNKSIILDDNFVENSMSITVHKLTTKDNIGGERAEGLQQQHDEMIKTENSSAIGTFETQIVSDSIIESEILEPEGNESPNTEKSKFIKVIELTPSGVKVEKFYKNAQLANCSDNLTNMATKENKQCIEKFAKETNTEQFDQCNLDHDCNRKDAVHFSSPLSVVYEYSVSQNTCSQSTIDLEEQLSPDTDIDTILNETSVYNTDMSSSVLSTNIEVTSTDIEHQVSQATLAKVSNFMTPAGDCCNTAICADIYAVKTVEIDITSASIEKYKDNISKNIVASDIICINDIYKVNNKHNICEESTVLENNVAIKREIESSSAPTKLPSEKLFITDEFNNNTSERMNEFNVELISELSNKSAQAQQVDNSSLKITETPNEYTCIVNEQFAKVPLEMLKESDRVVSPDLIMLDNIKVKRLIKYQHDLNSNNENEIAHLNSGKDVITDDGVIGERINSETDPYDDGSQEDLFDSGLEAVVPESVMQDFRSSLEVQTYEGQRNASKNRNVKYTSDFNSQNDIFDSCSENEMDIEADTAERASPNLTDCNVTTTKVETATPKTNVTCKSDICQQSVSDGTGVLYGGGGPIKKRLSHTDETAIEVKKLKLDEVDVSNMNSLKRAHLFEIPDKVPVKQIKVCISETVNDNAPTSLKTIAAHVVSTSEDIVIWEKKCIQNRTKPIATSTNKLNTLNSVAVKTASNRVGMNTDNNEELCSCVLETETSGNLCAGSVGNQMATEYNDDLKDGWRKNTETKPVVLTNVKFNSNSNTDTNYADVSIVHDCNEATDVVKVPEIENNNSLDEKDATILSDAGNNSDAAANKNELLSEDIIDQKVSKEAIYKNTDIETVISMPIIEIENRPRFITAADYHSQSSQVSSTGFTVDTNHQLSSQESCRSIPVVTAGECLVKRTEDINSGDLDNGVDTARFDDSRLDTIVDAVVDQVVPGRDATENYYTEGALAEDDIGQSLYVSTEEEKPKIYTCDIDLCGDDGDRLCQTVGAVNEGISISRASSLPSHEKCFKWKYTPSCDIDSEPLPPEDDNQVIKIEPLKTCSKPIRVGLSRRQTVNRLHKFNTH